MQAGKLYVVTAINAMGPVIDPRHSDLLRSWEEIDSCLQRALTREYRLQFPDDAGRGIIFSFFCISWSGFASNPVHRDFGWHTIFDHYRQSFGDALTRWSDEFNWMYNHPPASGIGNEWGLDWSHNTHYFNILNRFIIDRGWFPTCVEVPTERNDTSHFLEQWIPFDYGNRNSVTNNLASVNADGKLTGAVIDWRNAPHDWSHYHPSHEDYQLRGRMNRTVFRIVDIKSVVHVLDEAEIERAFLRCLEGNDTVLCAYEHDFRDRYETIVDLMVKPVHRIKDRYPEVKVFYASARNAAKAVLGFENNAPPELNLIEHVEGLRLLSSKPLFGAGPYVAVHDENSGRYFHLPLARIGESAWRFPDVALPPSAVIGAAAHDHFGNVATRRWRISRGNAAETLAASLRLGKER